jgi:hypothetical protein
MTNRLSQETSPYLQQHAENPVDWYLWGEEAFRKDRNFKATFGSIPMAYRMPRSAPTTGIFPWPPNAQEIIRRDVFTPSPIPPPMLLEIKPPPAPR